MYPYLGGLVPMQQSLRPFDGTDPTYTTEDFLKAITANMVMTAGPEQTDSTYHHAWSFKRIAMIKTALIGPAQQWYLHLPLKSKNIVSANTRNNRKHKKQMAQKAYVNNAPDMRNVQMNDACVKTLDPQLGWIALKSQINRTGTTASIFSVSWQNSSCIHH